MEVGLPAEVPLPERCVALAAGYFHTLCLGESGSVWAFGCNGKGQLGAQRRRGGVCARTQVPRCMFSIRTQPEQLTAVVHACMHTTRI